MRRVKVARLALAPPAVPAPRPALAPHRSQWAGCGYARIVWGRGLGEELFAAVMHIPCARSSSLRASARTRNRSVNAMAQKRRLRER
jgi:hypothetical protein